MDTNTDTDYTHTHIYSQMYLHVYEQQSESNIKLCHVSSCVICHHRHVSTNNHKT